MTGGALVIHRYVVGVGVVVAVGDAGDATKLLAVFLGEFSAEAFCGCGEHGVVVVIPLTEVVHSLAHVSDNPQTQFLTLLAFAVVLACQGHQTFCQTDEADAQGALVDDTLDGIVGLQFVGTDPQALHQQGELLGEGGLLELEAVVELFGCDFEHVVEFGEEHVDTLLLIRLLHTFDGEFHDVDGREGDVTAADGCSRTEAVLEHACATAHCSYFVDVALRVVSPPVGILVVGGVEVQEVGEEPSCRDFTGQLVEVEVTVLGQVVHAALLLPDLDGEDGRLAAAYTLVGGEQDLAHDATSFCGGVRTVVDRGEDHLITTARVDGVHVVDERLHRLVHASHGLVDGMLLGTLFSRQSVEWLLDIIHQGLVVEVLIALAVQVFQGFQFLDITQTDVGCQIEIEGGDGLTTVHLVLGPFHRDTSQDRCCFDALGGS